MKKVLCFLCLTLVFYSCKKQSNDPYSLPDSYSNQGLGKSANDLLSAAKYTTLNIQVQYMPGYALDPGTIANVTSYLNSICNKPGGINITQSQIPASGDTMTPNKVAVLEKQNRTAYTSGNTISLYIMVTDGYDTSVSILGFSYRNTSICLFGKDIFDHSGGLGELSRVAMESSVLEHELGHIMGLVNLGTLMVAPHQDVAHGNHCSNANCLMYYAIESHTGIGMYNDIPALDSNCVHDLRANGGK